MTSQFGVICAIILLTGAVHASIENSPVRVTHRNSGPRYDFEESERGERPSPPQEGQVSPARGPEPAEAPQEPLSQDAPIGHLSIRRIFLVPMMGPVHPPDHWSSGSDKSQEEHESSHEHPSMMASPSKPFWPFAPPTRHHILGGDEASRSPTAERPSTEREDSTQERPSRPIIDPIQMMIDMMHQALNPGFASNPSEIFGDLNKEATSKSDNKPQGAVAQPGASDKPTELSSPSKPASNNETKEEIVEIDGKKYLRKTVINRHVGENIVFMTKRLIFTPLNETDSEQPTITTTTTTTTTAVPQTVLSTDAPTVASEEPKKVEEPSSTTISTSAQPVTEQVASEAPSTAAPSSTEIVEAPSSTQAPNQEPTTGKESWVERAEAIAEKIAEAIEPSSTTSTTTAKPAEGQ